MPKTREQALEDILRSLMQHAYCHDDTFDDEPEDRIANIPLTALHQAAAEMDRLGCAGPDFHASWAEMWPEQG